jgi:hypothetical protein
MVMKRTTLLLAILAIFSMTSVSHVSALPIAGEKAADVTSWLSYHLSVFLMAHRGESVGLIVDEGGGNGGMLRGDADDYANGKNGDGRIGPIDDDDDSRRSGLTYPGGLPQGAGGVAHDKS